MARAKLPSIVNPMDGSPLIPSEWTPRDRVNAVIRLTGKYILISTQKTQQHTFIRVKDVLVAVNASTLPHETRATINFGFDDQFVNTREIVESQSVSCRDGDEGYEEPAHTSDCHDITRKKRIASKRIVFDIDSDEEMNMKLSEFKKPRRSDVSAKSGRTKKSLNHQDVVPMEVDTEKNTPAPPQLPNCPNETPVLDGSSQSAPDDQIMAPADAQVADAASGCGITVTPSTGNSFRVGNDGKIYLKTYQVLPPFPKFSPGEKKNIFKLISRVSAVDSRLGLVMKMPLSSCVPSLYLREVHPHLVENLKRAITSSQQPVDRLMVEGIIPESDTQKSVDRWCVRLIDGQHRSQALLGMEEGKQRRYLAIRDSDPITISCIVFVCKDEEFARLLDNPHVDDGFHSPPSSYEVVAFTRLRSELAAANYSDSELLKVVRRQLICLDQLDEMRNTPLDRIKTEFENLNPTNATKLSRLYWFAAVPEQFLPKLIKLASSKTVRKKFVSFLSSNFASYLVTLLGFKDDEAIHEALDQVLRLREECPTFHINKGIPILQKANGDLREAKGQSRSYHRNKNTADLSIVNLDSSDDEVPRPGSVSVVQSVHSDAVNKDERETRLEKEASIEVVVPEEQVVQPGVVEESAVEGTRQVEDTTDDPNHITLDMSDGEDVLPLRTSTPLKVAIVAREKVKRSEVTVQDPDDLPVQRQPVLVVPHQAQENAPPLRDDDETLGEANRRNANEVNYSYFKEKIRTS